MTCPRTHRGSTLLLCRTRPDSNVHKFRDPGRARSVLRAFSWSVRERVKGADVTSSTSGKLLSS
jgi:hypothetical protein